MPGAAIRVNTGWLLGTSPSREVAWSRPGTVPRASYVDPRVIEAYEKGRTITRALGRLGVDVGFGQSATHGDVERAVVSLLRGSAVT